jgi:ribokinase
MITVFGSINVDLTFRLPHLPAAGETVLTPSFTQAVGGKGANQAIAAARDGAPTRFIGCVGSDGFGATARAALADLGIDVEGLTTVPGATGVAAVWVDTQGRNQIAVASGANAMLQAQTLAACAITPRTHMILQMETPAAQVEAAIAHAASAGASVILNLAPALPLPPAVLRQVDILVVNEHEAAALCGLLAVPDAQPSGQVVSLAHELSNTVIITLGAEGAIGAQRDSLWRVKAMPVTAIDTTGAGDCFVGVLASALTRGATLPEAMRRAAVAGSLACTVVGAMPSFPTRAQIDAALAAVEQRSAQGQSP